MEAQSRKCLMVKNIQILECDAWKCSSDARQILTHATLWPRIPNGVQFRLAAPPALAAFPCRAPLQRPAWVRDLETRHEDFSYRHRPPEPGHRPLASRWLPATPDRLQPDVEHRP